MQWKSLAKLKRNWEGKPSVVSAMWRARRVANPIIQQPHPYWFRQRWYVGSLTSKLCSTAAILTSNGRFFSGCNVENASYGPTICAERNAVFQMIANGAKKIEAVVIYIATPMPSAPCGACRQVINEFGANAIIKCVCDGPSELSMNLHELLPNAFGPENLFPLT